MINSILFFDGKKMSIKGIPQDSLEPAREYLEIQSKALLRTFNSRFRNRKDIEHISLAPTLQLDDETRFLEAVISYDFETMLKLLQKVDINCTTVFGETALMLLAAKPKNKMRDFFIDVLEQLGADPNITSLIGSTAKSIEDSYQEIFAKQKSKTKLNRI